MDSQGFYTNKGRVLAAKINSGISALTITRVEAGSGHTADISAATSLPDSRQRLAMGTPRVSGSTATLCVTLMEADASQSYSLTELGIYANDPDEGEILFQVYQLDTAEAVAAGGEGTLRFYVHQPIGAGGINVTCSPAGVLLDEDLEPLRSDISALDMRVNAASVTQRTVSMPVSELQAYLDALPRLLTEKLTIKVSGNWSGTIYVNNFYGSGHLDIEGVNGCTLTGCISITFCSISIGIANMTIQASSSMTADNGLIYVFLSNRHLWVQGCTLIGNGTCTGVFANISGAVNIVGCPISNCYVAVQAFASARVAVFSPSSVSYSGNSCGAMVYRGGTILLGENTPDLLGGNYNTKSGGIIAKSNGTLL